MMKLLPYATSVEFAPDGARHVELLLAEPPEEDAIQELLEFVGPRGSVTWRVEAQPLASSVRRVLGDAAGTSVDLLDSARRDR